MKREWTVTDGMGNMHHITCKVGGFGVAKYTIDNDSYKLKSKNWVIMLVDNLISLPGVDCNLVVVGNNIKLAVNGVYLEDGTPYEPIRNLPGWINVMVTICGVIGLFAAGVWGVLLAVFAAVFAYKMALKGKTGPALGVLIGLLVLYVVWIVFQLLVLGAAA